ncbi:MAG: hypothetical protein A3E78_02275 [Alphaproteobacteria bacterium RIFCSPHIGHO2_12_FULL_63_12]|nr:MAG: hypothetical protein A3E78_02275 [Alphaproteobacteria bacterium RIFCSPHIGHO2_12_FULL_63_12]
MSILFLAGAACATAPTANAPDASAVAPIEVMVLGTWHFAGSDSDVISIKTDSVLAPKRQRELEDAVQRLAAFRPNVIVTERVTAAPDYVDPKFATFTDEDLATNADERVQVAYRLARRAGVARVIGLDEQPSSGEPDYFPFGKAFEHAAATGQQQDFEALIGAARAMAEGEVEKLSALTMSEALVETNRGQISSPDFYYELLKFDTGEDQPGAELNAYWFMRNAKIFSKLIDVTKPGDRVIVVYGAGHKFWLDHLVAQTPGFISAAPEDYLGRTRGSAHRTGKQ